jgi:amino-acid N-acetyltransferase
MALRIENARPEDKDAIVALLHQGQLLTDDLPADLANFVIANEATTPVGVAGLERFGPVGLLRSVAVDPAFQGNQIGAQVVERVLEKAQAAGVKELYLITTTADQYFQRHGFQVVDRQHMPASIQQTRQFSDLCPSSAIVMKRVLTQSQA